MKGTFLKVGSGLGKNSQSLSTKIIIGFAICSSTATVATPSFAGASYRSLSRDLIIDFSSSCSTTTPLSFYRTKSISGRLTDVDCSYRGADSARYKFIDVTGNERCYGRMTIIWGYRRQPKKVSIWEIDGAVSGFKCSASGKKFTVEIFN